MRKVIKGGDVNFSSYPDTFPSSHGQAAGVGCAGTTDNTLAAAGKFSQNGGYYSFGQPIGNSFGSSGTGTVIVNDKETVMRPMNNFSTKLSDLSGGRRSRQIGCKKGGKKYTNRRKASKHRKHRGSRKHHSTRKHHSARRHRSSRRYRIKRGGDGPQPYSNTPISFGQTFNTSLTAGNSALATPTPLSPVSNCPYKN